MYESRDSCFKIYDPAFLEQHDETTDFDCHAAPKIIIPRGKRFKKKQTKKNYVPKCRPVSSDDCLTNTNENTEVSLRGSLTKSIVNGRFGDNIDCNITPNYQSSSIIIRKVDEKTVLNLRANTKVNLSKWSLVKNKLIPRVSSIFRIHHKHGKQHEENEPAILSNDCEPSCAKCGQQRMRKNRRAPTQPVYYSIEGKLEVPVQFGTTQFVQVPLNDKDTLSNKNFSKCSLTSSSESEVLLREKEKAKKIFKKRMKKEFMKEYVKYLAEKALSKNQSQQYSRHESFQILNNSQPRKNNITTTTQNCDFYHNNVPSSSSDFWDSLFDNLNRKYETQQRTETVYPDYQTKIDPRGCCRTCNPTSPTKSSPTSPPIVNSPPPGIKVANKKINPEVVECKCKVKVRDQATTGRPINKLMEDFSPKKSPPISMSKQAMKSSGEGGQSSNESCRPCQKPHDKVIKSAQNKYHGEILCIHNPPCVLINGCLNLPSIQPGPLNVFSTTQVENGFGSTCHKLTSPITRHTQNCEQACQHHPSCIDLNMQQCQTSIYRTDKEIQSTCVHNPPCEIVRGCYKPKHEPILEGSVQTVKSYMLNGSPQSKSNKTSYIIKGNKIRAEITAKENTCVQASPNYDPKLDNYCVHVPMCQRLPECHNVPQKLQEELVHESNSEIPISTMDYLAYKDTNSAPGRSEFDRRIDKLCNHTPICAKLPKCVIQGIDQRLKRVLSQGPSKNFVTLTAKEDISIQANQEHDRKKDSFCYHIPMCEKLPECLTNGKSQYRPCDHRPKCSDVPICKRNLLTAKGDVSTQVKPKSKYICRHDPRCIMIPKCLGSIINDGFIPSEGIPECQHRPCCDLLPACCRKPAKNTVSVSSQYPASCRIV